MIWTAEQIETARQMWADEKSASEIARLFGVSRNAVIGVTNRRRDLFPYRPVRVAKLAASQQAQIAALRAETQPAGHLQAPRTPVSPLPAAHLPATIAMPFSQAIDLGRCLHFVGDPLARSGPDMPVCGAARAAGAPPDNRWCRLHLRSVAGGAGK